MVEYSAYIKNFYTDLELKSDLENLDYHMQKDNSLSEKDRSIIQKLLVQDSIANSILPIQKNDSIGFFIVTKNIETGETLTYKDLDSLFHYYKEQSYIYERILLSAKRNYKFNYSYQIKGDTIIISFWDK